MPEYCESQFGLRVRWRRAGTDADVTLMLWGSKAASGVISLRDSDHVNKFERAQTDTFKYIVLTCIQLYYNYIILDIVYALLRPACMQFGWSVPWRHGRCRCADAVARGSAGCNADAWLQWCGVPAGSN